MRRIAVINQKGGVGKTTTTVNLGAALAIQGRRVVVVDMDAQANLSLALGVEAPSESPTSYTVLIGSSTFGQAVRATAIPNLSLVPSNLDLSGAELELANAMAREYLLRDALREWDAEHRARHGRSAADYVLFDCPPSLGLLSINALAAAGEVLITLQTEFLALQGMSKLVSVVQLLKKRLNPELVVAGIVPCLYDSRLRLAREVLGEIRRYFKSEVFPHPVRSNVKLAEAPSFGQTIFEYAPDSNGAVDYMKLAKEILAREDRDPELASLPPFDEKARLAPSTPPAVRIPPPPPPRKHPVVPSAAVVDAAIPAPVKPIVPVAQNAAPSVTSAVTPKLAPSQTTTASAGKPANSKTESPKQQSSRPATPPARTRVAETPSTTTPITPKKSDPKTVPPGASNDRVLVPVPPPKRELDTTRAPTAPHAANIADDMPPLPPDAFEILSHPFQDS
jgi:chromosome partitioning protein